MDPAVRLVERYLDQLARPAEQAAPARLPPAPPHPAAALARATRTETLLEGHLRESRAARAVTDALPPAQRATLAAACGAGLPLRRRPSWRWCAAALVLLAAGAALGYRLGR